MKDAVTEQYERYAYPDPAVGVVHRIVWNDPGTHHSLYWPEWPRWGAQSLLVAGCGTGEAVALALQAPHCQVVGIDISQTALGHQRALAEAHGVANLELVHLPIERALELDRTFDFVSVAGVLHHLADPALGLRALGAVLRPHGVVVGAVYGRHARLGVNLVQQTLREMGAGQDAAGIGLARAALEGLAPHHPVRGWLAATAPIWGPDAHLVDAWLPAREVTYDTDGVLSLVAESGLAFQGWFENRHYHPDGLFTPDHPAHAALARLPPAAMWRAMARLTSPTDHCFIACRPDRRGAWRLDLDGDAVDRLVPSLRFPPGQARPPMPYDPRHPMQAQVYRRIDGQASIAELMRGLAPDAVRGFLRHLWRSDAIYLRRPDVPDEAAAVTD